MPGDRRSRQIRYKSHRYQLGSKSETRLGIGHMSWWEQSSRNRTMGNPGPSSTSNSCFSNAMSRLQALDVLDNNSAALFL